MSTFPSHTPAQELPRRCPGGATHPGLGRSHRGPVHRPDRLGPSPALETLVILQRSRAVVGQLLLHDVIHLRRPAEDHSPTPGMSRALQRVFSMPLFGSLHGVYHSGMRKMGSCKPQ